MNKDSKLYAFLGVFLTVIGFIIVYIIQKKDKYAMFYAKQGLILFIIALIATIITIVPVIGRIISVIIGILLLILWVIGLVYSLSGKEKEIPIIGKYAKIIKL